MIHFARLDKSVRLRELLDYLIACGAAGATTADILRNCPHVRAVSVAICELRNNKVEIDGENEGATADGGRVYRYRLAQKDPGCLPPARSASGCLDMGSTPQPGPGAAPGRGASPGPATEPATGGVAGELSEATRPPEPLQLVMF